MARGRGRVLPGWSVRSLSTSATMTRGRARARARARVRVRVRVRVSLTGVVGAKPLNWRD
jgi:hypothetical protein